MKLVTHVVMLVATLAVLAHKGRPESHIKSRERRFLRNTGHKSSVPVQKDLRALLNIRKRLARIKRELMTAPPKSVKVEIKFKTNWLDKMADKSSSQYKLMDGNIVDAVATELIGDSDFLDSHVMTLKKSDDSEPKVLSDIDFNFITEEQDPVRHLRAIIAQGRISGLLVYPDYFNILKDGQPSSVPTNSSAVNINEFIFDLKLKQDWYPFLSDQSSSPFKTLSNEILKTVKQLFAQDPYFIDADIIGFTKDKDGHTHVQIRLKFRPSQKDHGKRLKDMVLAGKLGNIPVFDDYFNGQLPKPKVYRIITPPVPPPMVTVPPTQEKSTVEAKPPVPILPTPQTSPTPQQANNTQPPTAVTQPITAAFTNPAPTAPPASTAPAAQSKSFDGEVKLQMDWYPFLADRSSFSYKSISGTIEDAIKQAYAPTPVIVDVNGLSKDPNGKLIASFNIRFPPGLEPSLAPLQGALSSGFLGGLPVFSSSENITTPLVGIIPIGAPIFSTDLHDTQSASTAAPLNVPLATPTAATTLRTVQVTQPPTPATQPPTPATLANTPAPATLPQVISTPAPATTAPASATLVQVANTTAPATPPQVTNTSAPAPVTLVQVANTTVPAAPLQVTNTSAPAPVTVVQVANTTAPAAPPQVTSTTAPATTAPTPVTLVQVANTTAPAPVPNTPAPTPATPVSNTSAPTLATLPPASPTTAAFTAPTTSNAQSASAPLSDVPNYPYNGGLIPLPEGMPRSCADIRSSGIGTMDGEYVIQAKPGCHLNIICQNMDEPLPKEYLGGPQQRVWLYWHYAVLIKLSDYDKKHIADQACLEKTAVGRDFINKVMLAGARQGNPLIPFKTNIKHMINNFIGKVKKRRSLEKDMTISTRATKIYKKFAL